MKKLGILFVTLFIMLLLAFTASAKEVVDSGECGAQGDNVTWVLYDDGELIVSGDGDMGNKIYWIQYSYNDPDKVQIKSIVINDGITGIGNGAFSNLQYVTDVTIADSVTYIGSSAFSSCNHLENLVLPKNLISIGDNAFESCFSLTNITFPDTLKSIGERAFYSTGLKSVDIPNGISAIEAWTFAFSEKLESVILPESVEKIGTAAFMDCVNLKNIDIPDGVKKIDGSAFAYTAVEKVVLPESVTCIGACAYSRCTGLTEVCIKGKNAEIYSNAFELCVNLTEVYVGKGVKFVDTHDNSTAFPFLNPLIDYVFFEDSFDEYSVRNEYPYDEISNITKIRFEADIVEDHEHSFVVERIEEATCTKAGKVYYKCECGSTCVGHSRKTEHGYNIAITPATIGKNGKIEYVCMDCGIKNSYKENISSIKTVELSKSKYDYNGNAFLPIVVVKDSKNVTLKERVDYTVEYDTGRKLPGKYAVKITFMGNYEGEKTLYFSILPGKTSKITATQSTSAIKLTWKKVTGADGYRVYQYNSKTGKYEKIKTLTGTSYTVKKLKAGTTYKFAVKAYTKDNGETLWASSYKTFTTATKPATPTVKATVNSNKVTLKWSKVTGATGYVIYMQDDFGDYNKIGSTKKTSYSVKNLEYGETCRFRVVAYKKVDGKNIYGGYKTVKITVPYPAIYVTPTGKRYHFDKECAGKNATKTTFANAQKTKTPCKTCVL